MSKPCTDCPWLVKNLVPAVVKGAARKGQWIPCHKNMGTCFGSLLFARGMLKGAKS